MKASETKQENDGRGLMKIDSGMPATLIVGNQELGCFVKEVQGECVCEADGSRIYSRIDEVAVVPRRSLYGTEAGLSSALDRAFGHFKRTYEPQEAIGDSHCKADKRPGCGGVA